MLAARRIVKRYNRGGTLVTALAGVDLTIRRGEFVAVTGASGAGKSTLLHILGVLEKPTSGSVIWAEEDLSMVSERRLTELRRADFAFIFQNFNLVPTLTAGENVEAAMVGTGLRARERRVRSAELLADVGLEDRTAHLPDQLSGGEQQRVAIARALANEPSVIFADEPTGNLDHETGRRILSTLRQLHQDRGLTVIVVTHDQEIAACTQRVVRMRDGALLSDSWTAVPLSASPDRRAMSTPIG